MFSIKFCKIFALNVQILDDEEVAMIYKLIFHSHSWQYDFYCWVKRAWRVSTR